MRFRLLLLVAAVSFCGTLYSQNPWVWIQKASFPGGARGDCGYFTSGDTTYMTGGRTSGFSETDEVWAYHANSNTWTQKADFPGGNRVSPMTFTIGNFGYLISGGYLSYYNTCWKYNPTNDTWT